VEGMIVRPRQVRYQAALRPDKTSRIDSNVLSNFVSTPNHDFWPRPCEYRAHCTLTVPIRSPAFSAGISLARRLSFSRASRFICNFICEYFLKTCASPWRSICVTHSSATPPALSRVA